MEASSHSLPLILLVEDAEYDGQLLQRVLAAFPEVSLTWCRNGEEALDYLYQRGKYQDARLAPRPNLVILDLGLPGISGLEVLQQIKKEDALKTLIVYIWTSGINDEAVEESIRLCASGYLLKTTDFNSLKHKVKTVLTWHFGISE